MRARVSLVLALAGLLVVPLRAAAQEDCEFLPGGGDVTDMGEITFMSRPRLFCSDGMRVSADSLRFFESTQLRELFGNVAFENADISLRARNAQYNSREGRITAQGNVRLLRKADGSSITGENLELLQKSALRPEEQLTVTGGRPHLVMHPKAREGAPPDSAQPFEVDAERIFLQGENMQARGNAELRRGELRGSGNEVQYFVEQGQLLLQGEGSVTTESYDLTGGRILLQMPNDQIRSVTAREGASLKGERLNFSAQRIHFEVNDGVIDLLVGGLDQGSAPTDSVPMRPLAESDDFTISGDSVEINAPNGALETVLAVGRAHATSTASDVEVSVGPELVREDWIRGDTILATFAPVERDSTALDHTMPDTTRADQPEVELQRLRARGRSRAFYRMPVRDTAAVAAPDTTSAVPDSTAACVAFHHVTGQSITIFLEKGSVTTMRVVGDVAGQHWDPPCAARTAPPPTIAPAADAPVPPAPPPAGSPPPPPPGEASARRWLRPARSSVLGS
jgi:lipopolysaccharide export system protein LptA